MRNIISKFDPTWFLVFALVLVFILIIFVDRSNAQVQLEESFIDINSLSADLKPLVSSSQIIYTKEGYALTPDMAIPQIEFLLSEIRRYKTAFDKCSN